jgi:enoyl-CoA hydratase/carnithine racemase
MRAKVGDARIQRKIALEGHRFTPQEALNAGLVDHLVSGDTEAVLEKAVVVARVVAPLAKSGVWGAIRVRTPCPMLTTSICAHNTACLLD